MSKRFDWTKILVEAGMIVLSVLLALFINEWKREYNERAETKQMLDNSVIELEENREFVSDLITYHRSVLERINNAAMSDSIESIFLSNGYFEIYEVAPRGVIQGDVHDIAWIVAKEEKISNRIPIEDAQMLFSTYRQQYTVSETLDRIIAMLGTREVHRKELLEETIITLALEWNEALSQEQELLYKYTQTLKKLKVNQE